VRGSGAAWSGFAARITERAVSKRIDYMILVAVVTAVYAFSFPCTNVSFLPAHVS
jgi:uncharacterized RDD family membrane protein YckC